MAERFLSMLEVADMLGVARVSIYNFIQRNNFPQGFKFGRARRWRERDVTAWIEQHAAQSQKGGEA